MFMDEIDLQTLKLENKINLSENKEIYWIWIIITIISIIVMLFISNSIEKFKMRDDASIISLQHDWKKFFMRISKYNTSNFDNTSFRRMLCFLWYMWQLHFEFICNMFGLNGGLFYSSFFNTKSGSRPMDL